MLTLPRYQRQPDSLTSWLAPSDLDDIGVRGFVVSVALQVGSALVRLLDSTVRPMAHAPLLLVSSWSEIIIAFQAERRSGKNYTKPMPISTQIPAFVLVPSCRFHRHAIGRLATAQSQITEATLSI